MVLLGLACTTSRESIISRTSVGLTAARAAFSAEDEREQMAMVDAAKAKPDAETAIAAHRKRRDLATKAFQAAWAALAIASVDPSSANLQKLGELATAAVSLMQQGAAP